MHDPQNMLEQICVLACKMPSLPLDDNDNNNNDSHVDNDGSRENIGHTKKGRHWRWASVWSSPMMLDEATN